MSDFCKTCAIGGGCFLCNSFLSSGSNFVGRNLQLTSGTRLYYPHYAWLVSACHDWWARFLPYPHTYRCDQPVEMTLSGRHLRVLEAPGRLNSDSLQFGTCMSMLWNSGPALPPQRMFWWLTDHSKHIVTTTDSDARVCSWFYGQPSLNYWFAGIFVLAVGWKRFVRISHNVNGRKWFGTTSLWDSVRQSIRSVCWCGSGVWTFLLIGGEPLFWIVLWLVTWKTP
jgi:hypothetical protein